MADRETDLFVIGAGSGGVRAARIAAGHGARVMIAEEYRVGGTCVIRGCVPKKLLVYAARYADDFEDAEGYGWTVPKPTFDWKTPDRQQGPRNRPAGTGLHHHAGTAGVEIVKSRAVLEGDQTVRLLATGERVRAREILIATGGAPGHGPKIPGIEHVISSNEAFDLPEFPQPRAVQGGGYIAVEFAGIFNGLGAEVTLVYRGERHPARLRRRRARASAFRDGAARHPDRLRRNGDRRRARASGLTSRLSDGDAVESDQVMFAIGR